jgi:hypothetical protein
MKDPKVIKARFNSICAETGKQLKKGDDILYYPNDKKAYHLDSKTYQEYKEWKFDCDMLGQNY